MKHYMTNTILLLLLFVTIVSSTTWTPELGSSATKEQYEFYKQFIKILPYLDTDEYPKGSVKVYMYPGAKDQKCTDNTDPLYFTWYSTKYLVPILSGFKSNSCSKTKNKCPNEERFSGTFATCDISNVDNTTYRSSGFDRGHLVNSQAMAKMYGASCETFTMCNIAPMNPQLNRYDWVEIETLIENESEEKNLFVLQGSLMKSNKYHPEYSQCVCGTDDNGRVACSKVKESKCNEGNYEIRIPDAFYKIVYNIEKDRSWSFIYKHDYIMEDGVKQTPNDAFIGKNIDYLENYAKFQWPAIRDTAEEKCYWCDDDDDHDRSTNVNTKTNPSYNEERKKTTLLTSKVNPNFKYLSFYGLNPDKQYDIINIGGEGALEVKLDMYEKYKIPSFYGDVDGVFNRTTHPTTLIKGWEEIVETMYKKDIDPYMGKQLLGIFLGDELCCGNFNCWETVLEPVAAKFRALLGKGRGLIYTNECTIDGITYIPSALDVISIDCYAGWEPNPKNESTGYDEVTKAKKKYQDILASLAPHQRVILVPGMFACTNHTNMPLEVMDQNGVEKLTGYYNWAMEEPRIIGMNPWHFNNRTGPEHAPPCDMNIGAIGMPKTLEKLREIRAKVGPIMPANDKACSKYGNNKSECIASTSDCEFCTGGWAHTHGCYTKEAASRLPPGMFTCTKKK